MEDVVDLRARPAIRIILTLIHSVHREHKKTDHPNRDSTKPSEGDVDQYGFGKMLEVKIQPEMAFEPPFESCFRRFLLSEVNPQLKNGPVISVGRKAEKKHFNINIRVYHVRFLATCVVIRLLFLDQTFNDIPPT